MKITEQINFDASESYTLLKIDHALVFYARIFIPFKNFTRNLMRLLFLGQIHFFPLKILP